MFGLQCVGVTVCEGLDFGGASMFRSDGVGLWYMGVVMCGAAVRGGHVVDCWNTLGVAWGCSCNDWNCNVWESRNVRVGISRGGGEWYCGLVVLWWLRCDGCGIWGSQCVGVTAGGVSVCGCYNLSGMKVVGMREPM